MLTILEVYFGLVINIGLLLIA